MVRRACTSVLPGLCLVAASELTTAQVQWQRVPLFPNRELLAMAYDTIRDRMVLYGGYNGAGPLADTWEFDGTRWTERTTALSPDSRDGHSMVFDASRGCCVLFGGRSRGTVQGDTWILGSTYPATFVSYGAGCAVSAGFPELTAMSPAPWIGEPFSLRLAHLPPGNSALVWLGASRVNWAGIPLPLDPGPCGLTGCSLLASPVIAVPVFNWTGTASANLHIPPDRSLLAAMFFCQGFAADSRANPFGATTTNGGEGRFGQR